MLASLAGDALSAIGACLNGVRVELCIFVAACVVYHALFRSVPLPKKAGGKFPRKAATGTVADKDGGETRKASAEPDLINRLESLECDEIVLAFDSAFKQDDHRAALQCWNAMKRFEQVPPVPLADVVQTMQRLKKDAPFILRELKSFFQKYPSQCDARVVNDILESIGKRLDVELMDKIVEMLPSIGMAADQRTYETLLSTNFTMRKFSEVRALVAEMRRMSVARTVHANLILLKTELKMSNLDDALACFRELGSRWQDDDLSQSAAPRHVVAQLAELACREHRLEDFLSELKADAPLTEEVVHTLLGECVRQKDAALTQRVQRLARDKGVGFSDQSYGLLVKGLSGEQELVSTLFEQTLAQGVPIASNFALALISFCGQTGNVAMADKLYEHLQDKKLNVVSALIRFYADQDESEKACIVYETDIASLADATRRSVFVDPRLERSLMNAAIRCGRSELAKTLLDNSPSDLAKFVTMIRKCAAEKNLAGAKAVFEAAKTGGAELNSFVYNALLDACVECQDLRAAQDVMEQTRQAGMLDIVTFNTLIKAYLQRGQFAKGRALMDEMKKEGLQPNKVTFNELINAMIDRGNAEGRVEVWGVVAEMQEADVKPNRVTCSILLKCLDANSEEQNIARTMDLISNMDEPMDEVLLSSVVEACVRIRKPELLSTKLEQLKTSSGVSVTGSHTFGSLIKAYSHAQDIDGVWRCWKEMRSRHIRPTSITIGCMIEAVVNSGDAEGAYELVHQMLDDDQCRESLNAVIYCSVLKGFTREKKLERAWDVYKEMERRNVEVSVVTFNTIIDACARCGRMDQVSRVQEDMARSGVPPNLITYSSLIKGYCRMGDIQTAFDILRRMKSEGNARPDEIMYNSLLDGCAQSNLVDEGLKLLEEMQREGVKPSNFTLSILVKMMSRSRNLDGAFAIVEDIAKKHRIRPNVHVYTNLIQACISKRALDRAMQTLERMATERVQLDGRTYTLLVRGCLQGGRPEDAAGLLRAALRLPRPIPILAGLPPANVSLDAAFVNEAVVGLAQCGRQEDLAAPLLTEVRKHHPRIRIEPSTQRCVVEGGAAPGWAPSGSQAQYSKGRGKGDADASRRLPQRHQGSRASW